MNVQFIKEIQLARTVDPVHHAKRRDQILDALEDAVLELGFPRLSFKDVAQRCGLSQGLLNYYFKDKTEMILWLQWRVLETYNDRLWTVTHGTAPAPQRLQGLLELLLSPTPELFRNIRIFLQLEAEALTNPSVEHGMKLYLRGFQDAMARVLSGLPWWLEASQEARMDTVAFSVSLIKGAYVQALFTDQPRILTLTHGQLVPILLNGAMSPSSIQADAVPEAS